MIPHPSSPLDLVTTPRRVTVIPVVPPPRAGRKRFAPLVTLAGWLLLSLLLVLARVLGAQAAPARPDSTKPTARAINWTSDRRAFQVGDILQVYIDEYAMAQATKDNANSASRRRRLDIGATPPELPGSSDPIGPVEGSLQTGDAGDSRQRGTASRDTRYVGDVAVRVVAVTKEGLLQIRGTKTIDVDKNAAVLTLSGFVRPIDVGPRDVVRSEVIADAQIAYQAKGGLGKPRNGILTKILGILWP
jgi:flagellar L-ring protein precursor FlgH